MKDDFNPVGRKPANLTDADTTRRSTPTEQKFSLPEEVEANDDSSPTEPTDRSKAITTQKKKKSFWSKLTRKQWLVVGLAVLALIGLGVGGYLKLRKKPAPAVVTKPTAKVEAPKPTTEVSNLSGLQVAIGTNQFPVTGVIIENSPDARPQSGLVDAGVVFEAIAEGGITRFLALYQSDSVPGYLGPVRSARPYYLDYMNGFDAALAHVGGSPDALAQIKNQNLKDLDQFANAGAYQRVKNRYAPHNVYTSMSNLYNLQKSKGFTSKYDGFPRKTEKAVNPPLAKTIDLTISGPLYNVHYDYDAPTNGYLRNEGGKPHMDERTNRQLNPKNVIALVVPQGVASDRIHTTYQNIGSGKAFIFQDGGVTVATWNKSDRTKQITFTGADGKPVPLNPGQTWISLVGSDAGIVFKP